ncbi:MaoC family dehydratase [Iodobacter fluviatilis]|jgi:3-hydroxybutyryl-CoA dehydratase|uniref:(R)-hydratase n=1 Tax=Iodobacter fluviatilis TaxID=537 RepID=A0A7G3G5C9_9NEIS|nr:MaoC family dehydratase [Iodobacter fluviatilis]QBC42339.1 (R)-hydratase [Iodobacter fluviatilis]
MNYCMEDLALGLSAEYRKTITETDVVLFAGISGDNNPMHIDEEYAVKTRFEGRIAHGMLSASLISTVIGTRLPGAGAIYMGQNLKFLKPVKIGDTVTALVTVLELFQEKQRVRLMTECWVRGEKVIDGDALVWVPRRPQ